MTIPTRAPEASVAGQFRDLLDSRYAEPVSLSEAAPAEVAAAVGFYDQAHFTRHFRRHTSVTPARFARSHVIPKYDET